MINGQELVVIVAGVNVGRSKYTTKSSLGEGFAFFHWVHHRMPWCVHQYKSSKKSRRGINEYCLNVWKGGIR